MLQYNINQYVLVPSSLGIKGFHPNEFQSNIRIGTLRRNFLMLPLVGLHVKHAALGPTLLSNGYRGIKGPGLEAHHSSLRNT
jgi:hypothetical protein